MLPSVYVHLLFSFFAVANALSAHPRSDINGPCTGKDGRAGVCIPKSSCSSDGGSFIDNACPGTPKNIKCCTKASCQKAARTGDCRWSDKCGKGYETLTGLCPGPAAFKCCVPEIDNLGKRILEKAKDAVGVPCKLSAIRIEKPHTNMYKITGVVATARDQLEAVMIVRVSYHGPFVR